MNEPTLWEVTRRLDDTARRLDDMAKRMEENYVPRREYELRVGELEKDGENQASFRKQVAAGAIVGLILIVFNIIIAMTRVPGVGT